MYTTIGVGCVECSHNAHLHILAEFLGRTTKCCGNPKPNFSVGYAAKESPCATRFLLEWLRGRCDLRLRGCGRGRKRSRCWLRHGSGRWLRERHRLRLLWNLSRRGSRNRGRCERRVCGESIPPPVQRRGIRGWPVRWFRRLRCLEQAADNLQYRFIKKDSQREDSRKYECR